MRAVLVLTPFALLAACGEGEPPQTTAPAETELSADAVPGDDRMQEDVAAITDDGVVIRFMEGEEAFSILTAEDSYRTNLQPREIAIRAQAEGGEQGDVDALYRADIKTWSEEEMVAVTEAIEAVSAKLDMIDANLPSDVLMIRTGTDVEGGLPHTRGNAIVFAGGLPEGESLQALFLHELHHVMSRANEDRHDDYFALIGFEPCEFEEPEGLRTARLTNPDAPTYDHYASVMVENADGVIPFLHAARPYDDETGGRLPNYFGFGLLPVTVTDGVCTTLAEDPSGLLNPRDVPAYLEALGGNTDYVIHPEETLADNFTHWAMETEDLQTPELPQKVGAFWTEAD
ncbi:MAG: hypothetical protein V2I43_03670 [Parvularcula sp.]|nr:hypothetical protein [Parvularcula sp.]